MHPYILLYKTLLPGKYRHYLQLADGNKDKCHEALLHGTFYEEYDLYGFASKSEAERREYLTDAERNRICRRVNSRKGARIVASKWLTYLQWKEFYHRKIWLIDSEQGIQHLLHDMPDAQQLVIKPTDQCGGRGVRLLTAADPEALQQQLTQTLLHKEGNPAPLLVEERIVQDERLAQWNGDSVNTIRMNTFNLQGAVTLFTAFIRTGRKGSFVDNGIQGGLFASIDTDTGLIFTDGYDECGRRFPSHPDSGIPYRGQQIPRWQELVTLTKEIALRLPSMTYIGWDMTLTPAGWEPVEANRGEFVAQQVTQGRGLRKEFEKRCGLG
ncbi:MAG: hypothetical protein IJ785_00505 [Bacteroidales bacterium]|nr:hypothetical protein [Bacteroidales bacterium]